MNNKATVQIALSNDEIQAIVVGLENRSCEDSIADQLSFFDPPIRWSSEMSEALIERLLNESQGLR